MKVGGGGGNAGVGVWDGRSLITESADSDARSRCRVCSEWCGAVSEWWE